jgi:putative ABC transport system permease protein
MKRLALKLATEYPQTNTRRGINAELLSYKITNLYTRTLLWLLMGAVGFILLIACVNIANMQLARATTRSREIAIRAALGAGRGRIIRQLLTESLLLGTIGGLSGLALSFWFLDLLRGGIPADQVRYISGWETMAIDSRVVLFNFAISFAGGLIFGLAPAWQFSKPDLSEALKEGGRGSVGGARQRMRNLLIVSEVALALVLLVGAGLLGRGFIRMVKDQKTGFNPTNVLTMRTTLTTSKYSEAHQITAFYQQALARLSTLAGVESASAVYFLPASGSWDTRAFTIEGRPALQPGESRLASYQVISANYFQTMRIPLQRGREFNEHDGEREPRVAIISESLARRYFPGEDPLGRRVAIGAADAGNTAFTIVGVVGDVSRFMFDREPEPTLYLPHTQASAPAMYFAVRTAGDPVKLLDSMRAELARVDPDLPYYEVKTLEKVIDDQLAGVGMVAGLIVAFGAMALLLSAAGVYGVMAYAVAQRTHEIGIRMALGARPRDVLRLVVGQAVKLTAIGAAIGLPAAFALSRLMVSLLFGVVSFDIVTFILFTVTLAATAVLASYLPARRAASIAPLDALRYQ